MSEGIRWLDLDALMAEDPPPVPWLVEPLLARGAVTLLNGGHGVGKSLLAIAIASAVTHGHPIAGMTVTAGRVVILDAENGQRTLHQRAHLAQLSADRVRAGLAEGFDLRNPDGVTALHQVLDGNGPVLLVLDSLASLAPGLKENEADQVAPVLDRVRRLAQTTDAAVLLLHHARKDGDSYRGGTAIPAAADVVAVYSRPRDSIERDRRVIDWSHERGGKMRLGPEPDPHHLRVNVAAGLLTVSSADAPAPAPATPAPRDQLRHAALAHLAEHGPTNQADLLRAIGRDPKDRTGRRALKDAEDHGQATRDPAGAYTLTAQGGNGATPATATRHPVAPGVVSRQAPRRGELPLPPATPEQEADAERLAAKYPELRETT